MGTNRLDYEDRSILMLSAVLDAASVASFQRFVDDETRSGARAFTSIDASRLRLVDAIGLQAIVRQTRRCSIKVQGLRGQPLRLFRLLRLESVIAVDSEAEVADAPTAASLSASTTRFEVAGVSLNERGAEAEAARAVG